MHQRRLIATLCVPVLLAACAAPTGVVPIGDGIYMNSKMDYMAYSSGAIKADLFREAGEFCAKQGKKTVPVSSKGEDAVIAQRYASAEVQFRCQ